MYRSNHRKRGTSAVSLVPKFTFVLIVQTCTWGRGQMSSGSAKRPDRPPTPTYLPTAHTHIYTNTQQWYSGQTVWARTQSAAFIGSLSG